MENKVHSSMQKGFSFDEIQYIDTDFDIHMPDRTDKVVHGKEIEDLLEGGIALYLTTRTLFTCYTCTLKTADITHLI